MYRVWLFVDYGIVMVALNMIVVALMFALEGLF